MPNRSRGRPAGYDRERQGQYSHPADTGHSRGHHSSQEPARHRRGRDGYHGVEADPEEDEEDEDEDDEEEQVNERERYEGRHRSSKRREDSGRRHRRRPDTEEDEDEDESESEVIVVDSRPNFARPPNIKPTRIERRSDRAKERDRDRDDYRDRERARARDSPAHISSPRGRRDDYYHGSKKAKESPATSPVKKRDRDRDREGHNRHRRSRRDSTLEEEPDPGLKDRRKDRNRESQRRHYHHEEQDSGAYETEGDRHNFEDSDHRARRKRGGLMDRRERRDKHASGDSANSATMLLKADALAKLNQINAKQEETQKRKDKKQRKSKGRPGISGDERGWESPGELRREKRKAHERDKKREKEKKRFVSGAMLEEGRSPELKVRGGGGGWKHREWEKGDPPGGGGGGGGGGLAGMFSGWSKKKKIWAAVGVFALLLAIIIPVAVVVSKKGGDGGGGGGGGSGGGGDTGEVSHTELNGIDRASIPADAKGTHLDPFSWYDTADFNVTYTDETVGGLPIMGLNSTWDDSTRANSNVPPLNKPFPYGKQPIRGVNVGGWLSLEPFITPSFFSQYATRDGIVDEYTLTKRLGNAGKQTLEKHYATFINEKSFREIRDAGFDHVRIPYGYWVVTTYEDDPYFPKLGWRYLLRAIEYCRKFGIRVSLDMHGVPGSQNGWNHSGRQGDIKWLHGDDGEKWGQRSLDVHDQLSKFFAQPRYKNVIAMYGLANEPMMLKLEIEPVLDWTQKASKIVEDNGMKQLIVFGDGFLKLSKWKTILQDTGYNLLLDTHQYTIFNNDLLKMGHRAKLQFICDSWVDLIGDSNTKGTGWGPTICGEWSQADTDCAKYINSVNVGARWTGTMANGPAGKGEVLTPMCPADINSKGSTTNKHGCSCEPANAHPSAYSDSYKQYLKLYAEAQIYAFEKGWGWFYWTWDTEEAVHWSWRKGLEAGILPAKAYEPAFKCGGDIPDFGDLPEFY